MPYEPADDSSLSPLFHLFTANQRAHALLDRAMAGSPLRSEEYAAYSVIFEAGQVTPTEFARTMGLPLTTALDLLKVMLGRDHVRKIRNPRDQRSYLVELTEAGGDAHREANRYFVEADDRLTAALGASQARVSDALHLMMEAAERALDELEGSVTDATG